MFPTPTSTTHCPPPSGFKPKPKFLMSDPISVFSSGNTYSPSGRVQACPEDTGDAADGACLASTALLSHREVPSAECLEAEAISAGANAQVQLHIDPPLRFSNRGRQTTPTVAPTPMRQQKGKRISHKPQDRRQTITIVSPTPKPKRQKKGKRISHKPQYRRPPYYIIRCRISVVS